MSFHLARWKSAAQLRPGPLGATELSWLQEPGSLTTRLMQHGTFSLNLLGQKHARMRFDERQVLGQTGFNMAIIRSVVLHVDNNPAIYARSVIPLSSLRGKARRLVHLGRRPLADLLFTNGQPDRDPMQYAHLDNKSDLARDASRHLGCKARCARRSIFWLAGYPLLVCEVFSQDLPDAS